MLLIEYNKTHNFFGGSILLHNLNLNNQVNTKQQNTQILLIIIILFLMGILFPTSINGVINNNLQLLAGLISLMFMGGMLLIFKKINFKLFIMFFITNTITLVYTLFTVVVKIDIFNWYFFLLITMLFFIDIRSVKANKYFLTVFEILNAIIIITGFLIIFNNSQVGQLLINYYSSFYPELVPNMLFFDKPVFTFGTHSIAGFYMFVFFFLNYSLYKTMNKMKFLIIANFYLYFCFALKSNTSLTFLLLGLLVMFWEVKNKTLFLAKLTVSVALIYLVFKEKIKQLWINIFYTFQNTTSSEVNGLIGRYVSGNQSHNLEQIANNPFSGIGFAIANSDIVVYDSGIVSLVLRGSIFLALLFYISFFYYLKRNMINKKKALFLFIVYLMFELAYGNLFYFRTIALLPFIIVLFNFIETEKIKNKTFV
jgi:hypothetical protein